MAQSMDKFKSAFREEAFELLGKLEDQLLELESQPLNGELINAAFRAIHTVKGSAAMFGFDGVSKFAHEIETALDLCRSGKLSITKDFIGLALKARDHLSRLMEFEGAVPEDTLGEGAALLRRVDDFVGKEKSAPETPKEAKAASPIPNAKVPTRTYRISFVPKVDILKNGTKVLNLVEELAAQGARAVALDVIFDGLRPRDNPVRMGNNTDMESDRFFAVQMRRAGNVILAMPQGLTPPLWFRTNAFFYIISCSNDSNYFNLLLRRKAGTAPQSSSSSALASFFSSSFGQSERLFD